MDEAAGRSRPVDFDTATAVHRKRRRPLRGEVVSALEKAVGPEHVLSGRTALEVYARDSWPLAALRVHHGAELPLPDVVVLPGGVAEVSAVLEILYEHEVPVIPYGGGSGVLGGTLPVSGGVVVDVKRLDRVLEINDEGLYVTAQAGILAVDLERALARAGLTLGHFPQSVDVASLGGLIATRSAGQFSTKYGNIEDMLLALEVVLPGGKVVRTRLAPRSSTGPDVKNLFLGSEGTLGIVTEASLRVHPRPEKRETQSYEVADFVKGLELIRRVMRTGLRPAVIRLYDPIETAHSFKGLASQGRCLLLFVFEGFGRLVDLEASAVDEICGPEAERQLGPEPGRHWLEHRNIVRALPEFMNQNLVVDTLEVAATWDRVADLYRTMTERMLKVKGIISASAHSSHSYTQGTNLYITFVALGPDLAAAERVYYEIWEAAMTACLEAGGTMCHHHGVGLHRTRWMPAEHGEALEVLRRLKEALDPKGLMNPGKLFGEVD